MKRVLIAAALAATSAVFSWPAHGQLLCGNRDQMVALLERAYFEVPIGAGKTGAGTLIEIWATPDGATWTLLETSPKGRTCVRSVGTDFEARAVPVKKEETLL